MVCWRKAYSGISRPEVLKRFWKYWKNQKKSNHRMYFGSVAVYYSLLDNLERFCRHPEPLTFYQNQPHTKLKVFVAADFPATVDCHIASKYDMVLQKISGLASLLKKFSGLSIKTFNPQLKIHVKIFFVPSSVFTMAVSYR